MDRKKFLRNVLGTAAAVTIGKYLPAPVPDTYPKWVHGVDPFSKPGIGSTSFNIYFKTDWFRPHDVLQTDDGKQWYVSRDKDGLVMETISGKDMLRGRIIEGPQYDNKGAVKLCSAIPENYEPERISTELVRYSGRPDHSAGS